MSQADYEYLTKEQVDTYLKDKDIYPQNAQLTIRDLHAVKESIDGFVNLIYHICDKTGKSVVLKQIVNFPRSRAVEEAKYGVDEDLGDWTLDLARMRVEISVLIFWNAIYPEICPEIYLFDEQNSVIVMEDLIDLSLLRYELCRMHKQPLFAPCLGRFFAHNLFYSSDLHLTHYKRQELKNFFDNPEYTALDFFLFKDCVIVSTSRTMPKETWPLRKSILENKVIQTEIKRLRHLFLTDKECLIHTDLHASNIMINAEKVKIIDTEFAGFGPIAQDFGRLIASLCLNFFSWYGDPNCSEGEKAVFRAWILDTIDTLYQTFELEFQTLCTKYANDSYSLRALDIKTYLIRHFRDSLSYIALNATSRIGDRGICYDLERLSPENRVYPDLLILTMAKELLTHKDHYTSVHDFTDYLRTLAFNHPLNTY